MGLPSELIWSIADYVMFDDGSAVVSRMTNVFAMCLVSSSFYHALIAHHALWSHLIGDIALTPVSPESSHYHRLFGDTEKLLQYRGQRESDTDIVTLLEPYTIFKHITSIVMDVCADDFIFDLANRVIIDTATTALASRRGTKHTKSSRPGIEPLSGDYMNLKSLIYTSSITQASRTLTTWIHTHWRACTSDVSPAPTQTPTAAYFEVKSLCPTFGANRFWYDVLLFCFAASASYGDYWMNQLIANTIGQTGMYHLRNESIDTAAYLKDRWDRRIYDSDITERVWNINTITDTKLDNVAAFGDEIVLLTCNNMGCNIRFRRHKAVHPLANDTCGSYCSSWCFFDACYTDATMECGHPQCRKTLMLKHAIGINWHANATTDYVYASTPHSRLQLKSQTRLMRLESYYNHSPAPSTLYIWPTHLVKPSHMAYDKWNERCNHTSFLYDPHTSCAAVKHKPVYGLAIGHLQPSQLDLMPRIYFDKPEFSDFLDTDHQRTAYCSRHCRDTARVSGASDSLPSLPVYCLNSVCHKVFEPGFAMASFECQRVVFVQANGERIFKGYVCDSICMENYFKIRMRLARKRFAEPLDTSLPPVNTKKPRINT